MNAESITIRIDHDRCIRCGKCARVCPADVISQEKKNSSIEVRYINSCIACGHCLSVCPTDSIGHNLFPLEKMRAIDYARLPTPEQLLLLIQSRRSNRALTSKPIPEQVLQQIVEAARYAPTASNNQQVAVTVITDPAKLREVSDRTQIQLINATLLQM